MSYEDFNNWLDKIVNFRTKQLYKDMFNTKN